MEEYLFPTGNKKVSSSVGSCKNVLFQFEVLEESFTIYFLKTQVLFRESQEGEGERVALYIFFHDRGMSKP